MIRYLVVLLFITAQLSSCESKRQKLTLAVYYEGSSNERAGLALKQALEEEGWFIDIVHLSQKEAISALQAGEVDLAITSNEISLDSKGLRTIIPLYKENLFFLIRIDSKLAESKSIENSIAISSEEKFKVMFSYKDGYANKFAMRFLANLGINDTVYEAYYYLPGEDYRKDKLDLINQVKPDIIYHMGPTTSEFVNEVLQSGYQLRNTDEKAKDFSLGYMNSLAHKIPRSVPVIIPELAVSNLQNEAIGTLALYTSLISSENLDDEVAYELVKDIMWIQPHLIELNSTFFDMSEDFDRRLLNYRVHTGARNYFNRDEPGFFERYAELFGVIFSITVVLLGSATTLRRVMSQRKKDHVDEYYLDLMKARKEPNIDQAIQKVKDLEERALNQLVQEKLNADSSFVVLMQLIDQIRRELMDKQKTS